MALTARLALVCLALGACSGDDAATPVAIPDRDDLSASRIGARIENGLSAAVRFTVPDDAVSMVIEVRGERGLYFVGKLVPPSGGDLVESGAIVTRDAREVPGTVDWMLPNNPDRMLESGEYSLTLRGEDSSGGRLSENVSVLVYVKHRSTPTDCGVKLDFLVDRNATADYETAIDGVVDRMVPLLYPVGIGIIDYQIQQVSVPLPSVDVTGASWRQTLDAVNSVLAEARASGSARPDAVHLVLVKDIVGRTGAAGYSMGLPGPYAPDRPTSAVLISTSAWTDSRGEIDVDGMYTTVSHEMGHFLGLYHTSEIDGLLHDPIADTPECSGTQPICDDDSYAGNIMTTRQGARRHQFTAGQGTVMRRHPLCRPHAVILPRPTCDLTCSPPTVCGLWKAAESCMRACDPRGAACPNAKPCVPDDLGVYVCSP